MGTRVVTFNAKSDSVDPGVSIFDHYGRKVGQNSKLNFPNKCWGSAIYLYDGTTKIRVATKQQHPKYKGGGNIWEIAVGADNQVYGETLMETSWTLCESVATFRDSTILINESIWIMIPNGNLQKIRAGSDWNGNKGCVVNGDDLYVVTAAKNIWHIVLSDWDKNIDLNPVNLGSVDSKPNFVAVDPLKPHLVYIGGAELYQMNLSDNHKIRTCYQRYESGQTGKSINPESDFGGVITNLDGTSHLWYRSSGNLHVLDITDGDDPQFDQSIKLDVEPNGIGIV